MATGLGLNRGGLCSRLTADVEVTRPCCCLAQNRPGHHILRSCRLLPLPPVGRQSGRGSSSGRRSPSPIIVGSQPCAPPSLHGLAMCLAIYPTPPAYVLQSITQGPFCATLPVKQPQRLPRGSGFWFGAVLAAPSVPQGCLGGPVGVLLRAVRGAQKGPPYRCDSLFWGSLWGPLGCPVGSRTVSSLFLAPRGLLSGMLPSDSSLFDPAYLQTVACRDKGLGGLASISGLTLVGPGLP